ncbi:hypothetical protein CY35_02G204400 [Sphagnum magellanicum]|nr:hypothetical protein CY35_02G204400 [Sphagnum magellanicum]
MKMSSRVEHLQKRYSDEPRREKHWRRCDINLHRSFPPECRTSIRTKAAATHNPDPWISFCVCRRRCSLHPSCLQLQELMFASLGFQSAAGDSHCFSVAQISCLRLILAISCNRSGTRESGSASECRIAGDSEGKRGPGEHAWTQLQAMILDRNRAISMNCLKRRLQFACAAAILSRVHITQPLVR